MPANDPEGHAISIHLDRLLRERGMTLTELAARVGVTNVNLSVLKNGRAKAIRFTTLTRICEVLQCQPGDLLRYSPDAQESDARNSTSPNASNESQTLS